MNSFKQFLASHSITVHSVAAGVAVVVGLYYKVPAFQTELNTLWGYTPSWLKGIALAVAGIYAVYQKSTFSQVKAKLKLLTTTQPTQPTSTPPIKGA